MAALIRLDTHVVVWLYSGDVDRLSRRALTIIDECEPLISPMVELELTFLHEINRLSVSGTEVVGDLHQRIGLGRSTVSFSAAVAAAAALTWTRDPFDRLIVGDALASGAQLLTKDDTIRANCVLATW